MNTAFNPSIAPSATAVARARSAVRQADWRRHQRALALPAVRRDTRRFGLAPLKLAGPVEAIVEAPLLSDDIRFAAQSFLGALTFVTVYLF